MLARVEQSQALCRLSAVLQARLGATFNRLVSAFAHVCVFVQFNVHLTPYVRNGSVVHAPTICTCQLPEGGRTNYMPGWHMS